MGKETYKIGDKVNFKFIGVIETGVIENISENQVDISKHNLRFDINDGKYSYPVGLENIIGKVK
jgi:hypothetical protein|tara:strand:+ start:1178 stop:1369 length:192 start_codon:yes stop_codon:yes gene_type:complete